MSAPESQFDVSTKSTRADLESLLNRFGDASDVFLKQDTYPVAKVHGRNKLIMERRLQQNEMRSLLTAAYKDNVNGYDMVMGKARSLDFVYEGVDGQRYRVAVARDMQTETSGPSATFRRIKPDPWTLKEADTPDDLVYVSRTQRSGLILVTGPTGSGKSATLSSLLRDHVERENSSCILRTIEDPVEFVYGHVAAPTAVVDQLQVGTSVDSFSDGIRAHLRMAPTHMLVGEVRDAETAQAAIWAAQSGHLVYATMHPNTIPELFDYWSKFFPQAMRAVMIYNLATTLKYVVCQHLVPTIDGKRIPVRECLDFTKLGGAGSIAQEIASNADRVFQLMREKVKIYGLPMRESALSLIQQGKVRQEDVITYLMSG
ncbi:type IV pilus twitching motility protein PilT [Vogesella sp. XCS3]|uniref:type IV pilus twitching motility protein PilT n=1 Tax=Vogesella sp. XCS3 TaxID=2877939 RepID=UPI001D0B4788|nr:ATPase, T2SS/T4P/T4SS family [Vogesella sp. XCS3]UDM18982.1 Flp pilus assembly complex ATPase component TadA [Vogesella sp. XCS3]